MDIKEIEDFLKSLKACVKCGSVEGFWLVAKFDRCYVQCKHCGEMLEFCEVFSPPSKGGKEIRRFLKS